MAKPTDSRLCGKFWGNMNRKVIRLAIKAAEKSPSRFRVGAVIFRGSKILGVGFNDMDKTHPKAMTEERKRHAEFSAAMNAKRYDLKGARMYVVRLKKDGTMGNAKPCEHCAEQIMLAGIKSVGFSTDFTAH